MHQYVDIVNNFSILSKKDNIEKCKVLNASVSQYEVKYTLFKYKKEFENKEIEFYSISVHMYDKICDTYEYTIVKDVTSVERIGLDILNCIYENLVTPVTAKDCIYDLLVERYG